MERLKKNKKRLVVTTVIALALITLFGMQIQERVNEDTKQENRVEHNKDLSEDLRDINWELRDRVFVLSDALNKAQTTMTDLEEDNQKLAKENLRLLKIIEESGAKPK